MYGTRLLLALGLLVGTLPGLPAPSGGSPAAPACTCMSPKRPVCEVWWQTSAIFVGRVTRIRTVEDDADEGRRVSKIVTMRVQERFLGLEREREVEVRTGAGGGDCGFDFQRNRNYLVYAGRSVMTGRLETGICSRTALEEQAQEDLEYLRGIGSAEKIVNLYGMVFRDQQTLPFGKDTDKELDPGGPLAGVTVRLTIDGVEHTVVSDSEGWYELDGLPPGDYEVQLEGPGVPPPASDEEDEPWRIRVPLAPACVWRNIVVPALPFDS